MFAALCLYMMSSINPTTMAPVRSATQDIVSPLLTTINKPIVWATDYVGAISGLTAMQEENMVLKAENARLREWYQTAMALQAENEALQGLMNVKLPPRHDYITTRII
ncbi:MAG: rod shape-determining protein MreC, partial [Pseudomonadota bacterium]|nr:rod shape-determining protein MreC [Pseudomonadota bacterium]